MEKSVCEAVMRIVLVPPLCLLAAGCAGGDTAAGVGAGPATSWQQHVRSSVAPSGEFDLPAAPALRDCLTYAAMHNPGLKAAFHRWRAAVEQIEQAGTLPDPKFTYAYYFQEVETRVGPQRQAFTLAQAFPWFGKLSLRRDAAGQHAQAKWHLFQAEKLALYVRVTEAYSEYYYLGRAVSATRDNLKLLELMERLVRTRYRTAAANHPDIIRVQIELGKLADRLESLERLRGAFQARLDAALGRPAGAAELPWPESVPYEPVSGDLAQLTARMADNPQLRAMTCEVAAAQHGIDLAKKQYYPDITLAGKFIDTHDRVGPGPSDDGQDAVVGMVTVNVPIWRGKLAAGVREARHRHTAAVMARARTSDDLAAHLREALFQVRDAGRKARLYSKTLIPKARESLKVIQTGFGSGTSNFNDLIDAQRVLLEFELSHHRALADHARWRAVVEQVVGGPGEARGNPPAAPPVRKPG